MKTHIPYIITIILLVLFGLEKMSGNRSNQQRFEANYKAQVDSTTYFKNKFGNTVGVKLALSFTEKELRNATKENSRLKESLKDFKKTIAVLQSTQKVVIDSFFVPFEGSISCDFSKPIDYSTEWYSFEARVSNKGFSMLNFDITPNNQEVVFGWKKKSFFSRSELTAEVTNSNDLFVQTDMRPFVTYYKRSWYEKPIYTVPVGMLLGILIVK